MREKAASEEPFSQETRVLWGYCGAYKCVLTRFEQQHGLKYARQRSC